MIANQVYSSSVNFRTMLAKTGSLTSPLERERASRRILTILAGNNQLGTEHFYVIVDLWSITNMNICITH